MKPTNDPNLHSDSFGHLLDVPFFPNCSAAMTPAVRKLGYVWEPDVIPLSYSRFNTLHSCPRKFLLKELKQQRVPFDSVDCSYGTAFGAGVQELFRSGSIDRALVAALAAWDYPEFEDMWGKKHDKSLWMCIESLEVFYSNQFQQLYGEYDLAFIEGKSGIELFVYIAVGESYSYQVHIDLVLTNRESGALAVVEVKTSGLQQQEANWGNSEQTLGYYAIIETLSRRYNLPMEPRVYYITQTTGKLHDSYTNHGFNIFCYEKDVGNSANFVQNLLVNIAVVELYIEHKHFPKRGNSCVTYNKPCEFYGTCDMESMLNTATSQGEVYESLSRSDCDFIIDMEEMITSLGES
jgi:hypothetical protein